MTKSTEVSENTIMPFGMHKGEKLANVPANYLLYLLENKKCYGTIKEYIQENKKDLEILSAREKKKWMRKRFDECDATEADIY